MNASDSFFDRERKPSKSETSRPRAVNPRTGVEQSWQQASNYASPLDNPHGLITWKLRELVKGLSLRPDLTRMLLTGAAIEDNAKADEIILGAHSAVAIDAKANEGTAVHAALSRSFLGHEVPSEYMPHVRAFAAELQRNGLTPVATEVTVLNVALGVLGHTDWVVQTVDGRRLILDVKTGKLGDAKRKFAVQCKAYAGAEYIDDGKGNWIPVPFALDQTEAILAHVDPETGATALYRVDLVLGFYGASLAERVRDWSKIEVLAPYVPVHHAVPQPGALMPTAVQNRGAVDAAAIGQRVDPAQPGSIAVGTASDPNQVYGSNQALADAHAVVAPDGTVIKNRSGVDFVCRFDGKLVSEHPIDIPGQFHCISPEPRPVEELLKPTEWMARLGLQLTIKADPEGNWARPMALTEFEARYGAEIQLHRSQGNVPDVYVSEIDRAAVEAQAGPEAAAQYVEAKAMEQHAVSPVAPSLDPAVIEAERADLMQAKNDKSTLQVMAKNLGCPDLAHNRQWLADWIIATRRGCDNSTAVMYAKSKGTMALGTAQSFSAKPARAESTPFSLKLISEAQSVADIERFRAKVVEASGDHGWTNEMTEAARVRVAELDAQNGVTASPALQALNQIGQATEPQHIAALWTQVTVGGSVPENWTDELREAADKRLAEIQANQPPPPANPYGPPQ